jgi:hypothetical protein
MMKLKVQYLLPASQTQDLCVLKLLFLLSPSTAIQTSATERELSALIFAA